MFNSVRWKLLGWYAVTLATLIVVFAALLWLNVRRSIHDEVDRELLRHAKTLSASLQPEADRFYLDLSPEEVAYFAEGDGGFGAAGGGAFYAIWNRDGSAIDASDPAREVPRPSGPGRRERGRLREVGVAGPGGSLVLVGKGVDAELGRLADLLGTLLVVGGGTLLLTLVGGWFLTRRALAPIDRITRAAADVSASNLSRRIDVAEMETELRHLSATINGTFDRLQSAFERQARFTADASHELRTPLSILLSHADLALKRDRDPEEYREALSAMRRAGQRMRAVVEGLLTLARADAGDAMLRRERLPLHDVVHEACGLLAPLAAERKVGLVADADPVDVDGDRDRLGEAVTNMVCNAIRYNREGGTVTITLRTDGGSALLTVADTGHGIPAADLPHVFERFYRVDKARTRSAAGSGLGLAITKWIVEAHDGSISVESREGEGTTFAARLQRVVRAP